MTSRLLCSMLPTIIIGMSAGAATPVATISSSAPFEVRGVRVPVAGVPSWPLVQGDVVATTTAPAVVSFSDLSQATVQKDSRIEIKRAGNRTALRLLKGSLSVRWSQSSDLQIQTADRSIEAVPASQMSVSLATDGLSSQATTIKASGKKPPPPPPPPPSPHQ